MCNIVTQELNTKACCSPGTWCERGLGPLQRLLMRHGPFYFGLLFLEKIWLLRSFRVCLRFCFCQRKVKKKKKHQELQTSASLARVISGQRAPGTARQSHPVQCPEPIPLFSLPQKGSIGFPGFPGANGEKGTRVRVALAGCFVDFSLQRSALGQD